MNSLNSMLLEGNVVRDPVLKTTPKGTPVCTFSIASNRYYRQDDVREKETSFFEVETWGKLAEACGKSCVKGRGVRIVGRMKQDRWTGSDGRNYSRIKLVGEHVEFKPVFSKTQAENPQLPEQHTPGTGVPEAAVAAGDAAFPVPAF
ncbi:MAG: single-stranded DNA-binding protein [Spirochaetes bacterium]|uniref:Single-stranded DNA-binding protein n=1 Tax=Candidatus Avitreponema avistercoris TaxID=2840705 RepID=A0A9D9ER34_9SPIR|nr:single-stranded DNA-binding protein [Candidatus Avitreponema avistercoris]